MEQYGSIPGEEQRSSVDRGGFCLLAVFLTVMLGYNFLYYIPAQKRWEDHVREQQRLKDEEDAKRAAARKQNGGVAPAGSATAAAPQTASSGAGGPVAEAPLAPAPAAAEIPHDEAIAFETPEHDVVLDTAGASVRALTFKHVKESTFAPEQPREADTRTAEPFQVLRPVLPEVRHFAVEPQQEDLAFAATADWKHEAIDGGHRFTLPLGDGWVLRKEYLKPEAPPAGEDGQPSEQRAFHFTVKVRVENHDPSRAREFAYYLNSAAGMINQDTGRTSYGHETVLADRDQYGRLNLQLDGTTGFDRDKFAPERVVKPEQDAATASMAYFGLVTKYFAAVVVPLEHAPVVQAEAWSLVGKTKRTASPEQLKDDNAPGKQGFTRGLVKAEVGPLGYVEHSFMVYVGPRQEPQVFRQPAYEELKLGQLVYYGWGLFAPIARLLHWILTGFHAVFGNFGVAILCLTVVVRLSILPLSLIQQKSVLGMQKVAPEINLLKEKYSNADGSMTREQQMAFQQEQMELFRKHGVNPLGCIGPIFLQMPVFIALYNVCNYTADLRGSPFLGWIRDLSNPDVLFRLPFTLPLLGTNAFSVLPLLMIATYFLQQKMQPPPTDPKMAEQQAMMKWIFPIFGLLFYAFPSGLLLYFVASSLWGIAEQKFIKDKMLAKSQAEDAARAGGGLALPGLANVGARAPLQPVAAGSAEDEQKKTKKNKRRRR